MDAVFLVLAAITLVQAFRLLASVNTMPQRSWRINLLVTFGLLGLDIAVAARLL